MQRLASMHTIRDMIAIVGASARFPGGSNLDAWWKAVREGRNCTRHAAPDELAILGVPDAEMAQEGYRTVSGRMDGVFDFDAALFRLSAREAELWDPQLRHLLECAHEAMEEAGYVPGPARRVGVYVSASHGSYLPARLMGIGTSRVVEALQAAIGNDRDYVATHLSHVLNLTGPSLVVQSACSSSLVAIHLACQSLLDGECDMALAGGVSITMPQDEGYVHREGLILSPGGVCRPFDARADGTVNGNGAGVLLLKRAEDALADNDPVHALLLSTAVGNDGSEKAGYTAPSVTGEADAIRTALALADVEASNVGFVSAHGTATALGDPIEIEALRRVFPATGEKTCVLGASKANIGHLDAAAGVAGLMLAMEAVRRAELPPIAGFGTPNPLLELDRSPFSILRSARPWNASRRIALANSFGFGGTNACAVLADAGLLADARKAAPRSAADAALLKPGDTLVLPLSARSAPTLRELALRWHACLDSCTDPLGACRTAALRRPHASFRRVALGRDAKELRASIEELLSRDAACPESPASLPAAWKEGQIVHEAVRETVEDFLAGREADWNLLYKNGSLTEGMPPFLHVPTTPFVHERFVHPLALRRERLPVNPIGAAQERAAELARLAEPLLDPRSLRERDERLDSLAAAMTARAFAELGLKGPATPEEARVRMGIPARLAQLVARLLSALEMRGLVVREGTGHCLGELPTEAEVDALRKDVESGLPDLEVETVLAALDNLPALLRGERDAREILMAGGDLERTRRVYSERPASIYCNKLVREHVRAFVEATGSGAAVRVLEIGGGTGATTGLLLPLLPPERATYVFTDVSCAFLDMAKRRFADLPFLRARLFDMERSPAAQGLELGVQDIVVAANVLHAAGDLTRAVRHAASLLRPGGMLLLHEMVRATLAGEVTTGLLHSTVEDVELRGLQPMASEETWRAVFEECGFESVRFFPEKDSEAGSLADRVISAVFRPADKCRERLPLNCVYKTVWQKKPLPENAKLPSSIWLLADGKIADRFIEAVGDAIRVRRAALPLTLDTALEMLAEEECVLIDGLVLDAGIMDAGDMAEIDAAALEKTQKELCSGRLDTLRVLSRAQEMLREEKKRPSPVRWTTLFLGAARCVNHPWQASLWGMDRVVSMGHPDLGLHQVDLANLGRETLATLPKLVGHLARVDGREYQSALDGGDWYVPRVERRSLDELAQNAVDAPGGEWQVVIGGLGGLGLTLAGHLAARGAARIALVGRNAPDEARREALKELSDRFPGTRFDVLLADAADPRALEQAVLPLEQTAPVSAFYHCAVDKRVRDADENDPWPGFWQIMRSKVLGAWNMHQLSLKLAEQPRAMVFFSSLVSVLPLYSLPHYVAANTFLDALACWRRAKNLPALSLSWGAWSEVGTVSDPSLSEHLRNGGLHGLAVAEALGMLDAAMRSDEAHLAPMRVDWLKMLRQYGASTPACFDVFAEGCSLRVSSAGQLREEKASLSAGRPDNAARGAARQNGGQSDILSSLRGEPDARVRARLFEDWLAGRFAALLKLDVSLLDRTSSLFDAGMDSLMFIEMTGDLEAALGMDISPGALLQDFTVRSVAKRLLESMDLDAPGCVQASCATDPDALPDAPSLAPVSGMAPSAPTAPPAACGATELERSAAEEGRKEAGRKSAARLSSLYVSDPSGRFLPFPLTEVQKAYWVGRRQEMPMGNTGCQGYEEFDCPGLEVGRLEDAWNRLVLRHEALRTVVDQDGRQRVLETVPRLVFPRHDLRGLTAEERERRLAHIRDELSRKVHDPAVWPLFDIEISILDESRFRLHLLVDNLTMDGWSISILLPEWARLYHEPGLDLPPIEASFRDYVLALERYRGTQAYRDSLAFWDAQDIAPAPDLPLRLDPGSVDRPRFVRHAHHMDPELWKGLKARCLGKGITPSAFLLTVFAEVLALWSRSNLLTVNAPVYTRLPVHEQIDAVVGEFTSNLLVTCRCGGDRLLVDRCRETQERLLEGLKHCQVGGVEVMRRRMGSGTHAERTRMPVVFTSTFGLGRQEDIRYASSMRDFTSIGKEVFIVSQTPQVWLDCHIHDRGGTLHVFWDAVDELFPGGMIDEMFAAFGCTLDRLAKAADMWSLVELFADTRPRPASPTSRPAAALHAGFLRQAAAAPERPAVADGERVLTYGELLARALVVERSLTPLLARAAAGVLDVPVVAVGLRRGWRQCAAVLGILMAGAAYVPVDPKWPQARRRAVLAKSGAVCVLCDEGERPSSWHDLPLLTLGDGMPGEKADSGASASRLERAMQPETARKTAYVIFTSGTTGVPKGVIVTHAAAMTSVADVNARFDVGPTDRVLALSSLAFDLSVFDLFGLWTAGGMAVLPAENELFDPDAWCRLMDRHKITLWNSVPTFWQMLVEAGARPQTAPRLALLSGDRIPVSLPGCSARAFPATRLVSLGGATEAGIWSIFHPISPDEPLPDWTSVPYGRPLDGQSVHVLREDLRVCPKNVPGRIHIGGQALAAGYLGEETLTRERFFDHPLTGERLYWTGDMGVLRENGEIEFLGRTDLQVKRGGYRIELGEIETVASGMPDVGQATAILDAKGRLILFLTPLDPGRSPYVDALRERLAEHLPAYMIPAMTRVLATMPLTDNGKVDRERLASMAVGDLPAGCARKGLPPETGCLPVSGLSSGLSSRSVPGSDSLEALRGVWSEVLGVPVAPADNVFALGADSLAAVRVQKALAQRFGLRLGIQSVFDHPRVLDMAERLERAKEGPVQLLRSSAPGTTAASGPCLVCLGDAPADTASFRVFANFWPLGNVAALSIDPGENEDLDALLDRLCRETARLSPDGTVHLAGYCAGGLLAWLMCPRLENMGLRVDRLLIVDSTTLPAGLHENEEALRQIALATTGECTLPVVDRLRRICALLEDASYPSLPSGLPCAYVLADEVAAERRHLRFWLEHAPHLHVLRSAGRHRDCLKKGTLLGWLGPLLDWYAE